MKLLSLDLRDTYITDALVFKGQIAKKRRAFLCEGSRASICMEIWTFLRVRFILLQTKMDALTTEENVVRIRVISLRKHLIWAKFVVVS